MRARNSLIVIPIIAAIVILILGTGGMLVIKQADRSRATIPVLGQLPPFEFTREHGQPFGFSEMKGKVSVINFFFASCRGVCPVMNGYLADLYKEFSGVDKVRFVSITVDPANDSLSVLKKYASDFGVNDDRWVYLWAPVGDVIRLSEEGLKLSAQELPGGHTTKLTLVDGQGRIRGYFDGTDETSIRQMVTDIRELAKQEK